jgi:hypothetical protein
LVGEPQEAVKNNPARVKSEGLWDEKIIVFISVIFIVVQYKNS